MTSVVSMQVYMQTVSHSLFPSVFQLIASFLKFQCNVVSKSV